MPCIALRDDTGKQIGWASVCRTPQLCWFCRKLSVSTLCDFPMGKGKTCSARMCSDCATHGLKPVTPRKSKPVDYCPTHKRQLTPQQGLFREAADVG